MSRGTAVLGILAVLATVGAVATADVTGDMGLFSIGVVLMLIWWLVRKVGAVEVIVASQPTMSAFAKFEEKLEALALKLARNLDSISDRATDVILSVEDRTLRRFDEEARRRHQLRKEFEQQRDLANSRLNAHGEKLSELGAKVEAWPKRKRRDS